jgi:hypothetical protein
MDGAERCPALDDVEEPPIVGPFRSPLESEGLELEMRRASRAVEADRGGRRRVGPFALLDDHLDREQGEGNCASVS